MEFDKEERAQLSEFWALYAPAMDELNALLQEKMTQDPMIKALLTQQSAAEQAQNQQRSRDFTTAAFERGDWAAYREYMSELGQAYARMRLPFRVWLDAAAFFRTELLRRLQAAHGESAANLMRALRGLEIFLHQGIGIVTEAYMQEHERVVREHQEVIRELSTPILRIKDKLLVAPVVGMIDTHRARQLTQSLLHAVRTHRARVVVLDVTGVPVVDSKVANHLLQTVEASRLMGAQIIVSGIAPEIAQTLVAIGADLGQVETVGEFDVALQVAERRIQALTSFAPTPAPTHAPLQRAAGA